MKRQMNIHQILIKMESVEKEFQTLMKEKIKKEEIKKNREILKYKTIYILIELIVTGVGFGILIYHNGWIAFGVWLAFCGNNLSRNRQTKNKNIEEIWKIK